MKIMTKIETGKGTIPLAVLIGIWSISALTSLPGLAVSPILGKLATVFPDSSQLSIQMLSSLPSFLIIPFILLTGKLTEKGNYIKLLLVGLTIFAFSGLLYLFADKMWQLIAISALLGVGAGFIIPLSTGLISKFFKGKYRTLQFGYSSAITNLTLVFATMVTGFLAEVSWKLPFVVYLLPIVSIVLIYRMRKDPSVVATDKIEESTTSVSSKGGINISQLGSMMGLYWIITFLAVSIVFYLPFLMKEHNFSSGTSGFIISLLFLAIMAPGLFLNKITEKLKRNTNVCSLLFMTIGFVLLSFSQIEIFPILGVLIAGFGYGIMQPLIYDKSVDTAIPSKSTLALAFVMTMNYLATLLCPFIIDYTKELFNVKSDSLTFVTIAIISLIITIVAYFKRDSFAFSFNSSN